MNALLALLMLVVLAGCSTTTRSVTDELRANLPRAQGLIGTFTPACLFLCFVEAQFTQGDTETTREVLDGPVIHKSTGTTSRKKGGKQ